MKAIILAGGKGTRGRPYTDYFPKAMIPIQGRPLIQYIIQYMRSFGFIDQISVLADFDGIGGQIKNYLKYNNDITFIQDTQHGTAGDLRHINLGDDKEFVLWFVDNLCAINLKEMLKHYRDTSSAACIATRTSRPEETGFALVKDGMIKQFKEKPIMQLAMHECLGIYILSSTVIDKIRESNEYDLNLSFDILEPMVKQQSVCAFDIGDTLWIDAESPNIISRNKNRVDHIIREMGF